MSIHTIITDKFVFGGNCLTKIDGKTIFVPFSLPNEHLEIEITNEKPDYGYAKIKRILKPSSHRVKPVCPLYEKCGGCNLMHSDIQFQRELKAAVLHDAFLQNGIELPDVKIIGGKETGYRCRLQLSDGGFSVKFSNERIPIENCPIAEQVINDWLLETPAQNRPNGRCHIFGSEKVVSVGGNDARRVAVAAEHKTSDKSPKKKHYEGTILSEENTVEVSILGKKIRFDARGFFQSNVELLELAITEICRDLHGKNALDIYAGCGTFSVFLSVLFENIVLVEHNRDALVFAEHNLIGKKHESFGLTGAKWARLSHNEQFDAAVIDPPRSGMEKEMVDFLCNSNIPDIRCLSCDAATQARDVSRLVKAGYNIEKAFLLDFYPNTSHIESLVVLKKS
ncbi:MAG: class I SAM-dependent RNA methyltransferase [Treponemataceae bacterium]|nr:class I SAM-dependent RNA methyltransferase [Treponemataceae bacterium]